MENIIISLKNLTKTYGKQVVLNHINLDIYTNEFVVIMGESGAGKSTLINIISFLTNYDSGQYIFMEKDTNKLNLEQKNQIRRMDMNIIFQKYNLFEELTIYENLITYLSICGLQKENAQKKIIEMAEKLNIQEHLGKNVSLLSHGEKQRVAIARSFLTDKNIIIADEPTASVDKENRDIIIQQLCESHKAGKTVIVVTHDSEYLKAATKKVFLSYGEITEI